MSKTRVMHLRRTRFQLLMTPLAVITVLASVLVIIVSGAHQAVANAPGGGGGYTEPTISSSLASPSITLGSSETDEAEVSGAAGDPAPTGDVQFYTCGPDTSAVECTAETDPIGIRQVLNDVNGEGIANSPPFTPTAVGTWCFGILYYGDNFYLTQTYADTSECFTVTQVLPSSTTVTCQAKQPCSASVALNSATFALDATSSTAATFTLAVETDIVNCGKGFHKAADYLNFAESGFTGSSYDIVETVDETVTGVCFSSLVPFTDEAGATVSTGILPSCSQVSNKPPCVVSVDGQRLLKRRASASHGGSDSKTTTMIGGQDCPMNPSSKSPMNPSSKSKVIISGKKGRNCKQGTAPPT